MLVALLWACGPDETSDVPSTKTDTGTVAVADLCDELGLTRRDWVEGPYETKLKGIADDFTVRTTNGKWTWSENYVGCEVLLFIPSVRSQEDGPNALWSLDLEALVDKLPANARVFWVPTGDEADLDIIQGEFDALPKKKRTAWEDRFHFVKDAVSDVDGWVGDYLADPGFGFAIDRFQRIRDLGSFADGDRYNAGTGWFDPNLSFAANDAIFYNFESDRQDAIDALPSVVEVPVYTGGLIATGWSFVPAKAVASFPSSAEMAGFNRLDWDMTMTCDGDGELGLCPAWDRIVSVYACSEQTPAVENPYESQACQPYVPGIPEVVEVLGTCMWDTVSADVTCQTSDECPTDAYGVASTCEGYTPPVSGVDAIPADTQACTCERPEGGEVAAVHSCDADGAGYGECNCPCDSEPARWITTYHREGRWVVDGTFALPWFQDGGDATFALYSIDPYEFTLTARLYNDGVGPTPTETFRLFSGGDFNLTYNDKYEPLTIDLPSSASKVELTVLISGHGGADPGNCAEFCSTNHHFTVNGTENLVDFPEAGAATDCQDRVGEGVVPNQYGTWFYGRSNWCPGLEIVPVVFDVTGQVTLGGANTFTYSGDYQGDPYPGGASIAMSSWLTVYE